MEKSMQQIRKKINKIFFETMDEIDIEKYSIKEIKKIFILKWIVNKFQVIDYSRGNNQILKWMEEEDKIIKENIKNNLLFNKFENSSISFKYKKLNFELFRKHMTEDANLYLRIVEKNLTYKESKINMQFLLDFFNNNFEYSIQEIVDITKKIIEKIEELILKKELRDEEIKVIEQNNKITKKNIIKILESKSFPF